MKYATMLGGRLFRKPLPQSVIACQDSLVTGFASLASCSRSWPRELNSTCPGAEPGPQQQCQSFSSSSSMRDAEGNAPNEGRESMTRSSAGPGLPIAYNGFGKKLRYPQPQNAPQEPWTPTHKLKKWKFLPRRMGFLLQELEKEQEAKLKGKLKYPAFRAGSVLELSLAIPDNNGKPNTFKGLVIAKQNKGMRTSFTIRNHMGTVGAIERTFPLYSPTIRSIKVLEHRHVRRAKLYYLRDRNPKEYRV